jgi:putative glycosyltransferase (TIGR04372 family)
LKHVRFGRILASNIGQFALVQEIYLSRKKCGYDLKDTYDIFFLEGKPCNMQIYKMVKNKLRITDFVKTLYTANLLLPGWKNHLIPAPPYYSERDTDHSFSIVAVQSSFDVVDKNKAITELEKYGMSPADKYVCLYIRDAGSQMNSSSILFSHDINDFTYLAEKLVGEGYYVLRMGKGVKNKFQTTNNKIIDYAYNFQSNLMDIWLSAHCEFMVGTGGGLQMVPQLFRRPNLFINYPNIFTPRYDALNSMVTFCRLKRNGKQISTSEMVHNIGYKKITRMNAYQSEIDFELEYQSQDEIIDAVDEMIKRINGTWVEPTDEKELNNRFWEKLKEWKNLKATNPPNPFHQFHNDKMLSKIGYNYLKANQNWLLT